MYSKIQSETESTPRPRFTGIFIPVEILDLDLTLLEQLLLAWIDALFCVKHGGCFAKNEYLANRLKVKENTIVKALVNLRKLGLIEDVSFDGRNRIIRAVIGKFVEKSQSQSGYDLNHTQHVKKILPPIIYSKEERDDDDQSPQKGSLFSPSENSSDPKLEPQKKIPEIPKEPEFSLSDATYISIKYKKDWTMEEIERAYEKMKKWLDNGNVVNNHESYLESIINNLRTVKKNKYQKDKQCQKPTKQITPTYKSSNIDTQKELTISKPKILVKDMPESPLAAFLPENLNKIKYPNS